MAWTWLLNLAPVADDLFKSITNVVGQGKKNQKLVDDISKKFTALYAQSVKGLQRDVAIISGWKPIVAGMQAVEATVRGWEVVIELAQAEKQPALALKVVSSTRASALAEEVRGLSKRLSEIGKSAAISWSEGGADLESALDQMSEDALSLSKVVAQFEAKVKAGDSSFDTDDLFFINHELGDIRGRMIVVVNYWDGFLRELAESAAQAPEHFQQGIKLPVKETIDAKFDDTKWSDILNTIYKAVSV